MPPHLFRVCRPRRAAAGSGMDVARRNSAQTQALRGKSAGRGARDGDAPAAVGSGQGSPAVGVAGAAAHGGGNAAPAAADAPSDAASGGAADGARVAAAATAAAAAAATHAAPSDAPPRAHHWHPRRWAAATPAIVDRPRAGARSATACQWRRRWVAHGPLLFATATARAPADARWLGAADAACHPRSRRARGGPASPTVVAEAGPDAPARKGRCNAGLAPCTCQTQTPNTRIDRAVRMRYDRDLGKRYWDTGTRAGVEACYFLDTLSACRFSRAVCETGRRLPLTPGTSALGLVF